MGDSGALGATSETATEPSGERTERGLSRVRQRQRSSRPPGRRRADDSTPTRHDRDDEDGGEGGAARRAPWVIATPFFLAYTLISVLRYERRETMSWDLGIFTQAVRQYAHLKAPIVDIRGQNLNLLGDHFHPILATLAPFFAVFPTPVTLLVAQAFLCAVAAVPITRTAMRLLGRHQGYAIGIAYGLSWGIVEAVNFDFHELAFAVPLLAFSLCAYLRGEDVKAICWAVPLVLVKEDIAPLACVIVGMVLHRRWRDDVWMRRSAMIGGVVAAVAVFFLLIKVVIPFFNPEHVYLYWSKGGCIDPKLHYGLGKKISCSWSQEIDGLGIKEKTVFLTLVPTAFLALRSPVSLLAVPAFGLKFLNTDTNYWGTDYHYGAIPAVIVFCAAIDGLLRIRASRDRARAQVGAEASGQFGYSELSDHSGYSGRPVTQQSTNLRSLGDMQLRHGAAAMLAVGVALSLNFPFQDLLKSETYKIPDRAHALKRAEAQVPDGVSVETTISMLAPLAARTHAYWIGFPNNSPAPEWVAIDLGPSDWNGLTSALALVQQRHPGPAWEQVYKDPTSEVYVFRQTAAAR